MNNGRTGDFVVVVSSCSIIAIAITAMVCVSELKTASNGNAMEHRNEVIAEYVMDTEPSEDVREDVQRFVSLDDVKRDVDESPGTEDQLTEPPGSTEDLPPVKQKADIFDITVTFPVPGPGIHDRERRGSWESVDAQSDTLYQEVQLLKMEFRLQEFGKEVFGRD